MAIRDSYCAQDAVETLYCEKCMKIRAFVEFAVVIHVIVLSGTRNFKTVWFFNVAV